ncbi:twin-arginine translocation pathway signal protein [Sansalvadorimonas verongulae]|uniref:twin-arginine translocation pathway signal protein n=1 Tax=Sansalvadorimonas verongulae TaxID=2172824 RepID=UPI0012BB5B4A|nr:twin-arginine translocation pathway signal protein [Sansalvadorimonas verongulae]MTI12032.1 twin-arginine translocation pathway signal protein [Sansalvadorimonas verongulae]
MNRRSFLKTGLIGSSILSMAGATLSLTGCTPVLKASGYQFLADSDFPFVRALFKGVIGPAIPDNEALMAGVRGFDRHGAKLSPELQKILRLLFDVATMPLTKGVATGVWKNWDDLSNDEIYAFLERWQNSRLHLNRMAHASLVQLTSMSWNGNPASFSHSNYPGVPYASILVTKPNNY